MSELMTAVTSGLYNDDQRALNAMTTERINGMLKRNEPTSKEALARLISEGKIMNDFVAPIGVNLRAAEKKPIITFSGNGSVLMNFNNADYKMHDNAINQIAEKLNIPGSYLRKLSAGDEWQRKLAAEIMNEHSGWTDRNRVLLRTVGNEVRGVLSDHYRRLNSMDIVVSFLEAVTAAGGVLSDGAMTDTKFWLETIHPEPIIIPTAKNGNVSLAFGARISSSDYGDGSLQIRSFVMQGVCLNGMVRESVMRQVHLGGRLPDNIQLSERTYKYDTLTQASAIKDLTKTLYLPETVKAKALEVQLASEENVDIDKELKRLQGAKITKGESKEVETLLLQNNPDDGIQGEATLWKLVNGITGVAREKEARRSRELQEIAGDLISRVNRK